MLHSLARKAVGIFSLKIILHVFYCLGVFLVTLTLLQHPNTTWKTAYLLFPLSMLVARFVSRPFIKHVCVASALLLLVGVGVIDPMETEMIEEGFILVPLLVLILYPGKAWAMLSAILLVAPYVAGAGDDPLAYLSEDIGELMLISCFANVMSYFQQRTHTLMLNYQDESRTDYLTQIPNRAAYTDILKSIERLSAKERNKWFLLLIDLNDFKQINDLYGHRFGDMLLRQFAHRLERLATKSCYRIGGDEFTIVKEQDDDGVIDHLVDKILSLAKQPYHLNTHLVNVHVGIGVSQYTKDIETYDQFVRNADLALFQAKLLKQNACCYFEKKLLVEKDLDDRLAKNLSSALIENQLFLHYQPKVDSRTGEIKGLEALIRWDHPELGSISPARFIPVAESSRQIVMIGRWVLQQACVHAATLQKQGFLIPVSVNVSAVQLEHDDIIKAVEEALFEAKLKPELLEIELTETSIMRDLKSILPILERIRAMKVNVAVDDFGVQYSSLNHLARLPVNILKIDKSFINRCHLDHRDRMMVKTIIQLADNLQMKVIAEGVELLEQQEVLAQDGCPIVQGYLYFKPMDFAALEQLLTKSSSEARAYAEWQ